MNLKPIYYFLLSCLVGTILIFSFLYIFFPHTVDGSSSFYKLSNEDNSSHYIRVQVEIPGQTVYDTTHYLENNSELYVRKNRTVNNQIFDIGKGNVTYQITVDGKNTTISEQNLYYSNSITNIYIINGDVYHISVQVW